MARALGSGQTKAAPLCLAGEAWAAFLCPAIKVRAAFSLIHWVMLCPKAYNLGQTDQYALVGVSALSMFCASKTVPATVLLKRKMHKLDTDSISLDNLYKHDTLMTLKAMEAARPCGIVCNKKQL